MRPAPRSARLEAVRRNPARPGRQAPGQKGFVRLPRRRVAARTFAWLGKWRRPRKDCEQNPRARAAWIMLAMIGLLLRRLGKS